MTDTNTKAPHNSENRKRALAQIHIAKKQLAMDDDVYREMLVSVTGKNSCKTLNLNALYLVIKHLEKCGFKQKSNRTRQQKKQFSPRSTGQFIDVMRALWIKMYNRGMIEDGSEIALTRWAKRQSSQVNGGIGIDELAWLERNAELAVKVLESLKQWEKRVLRKWRNEDALTVRAYREQSCLNSIDAITLLLKEHRIMHWPEFEEMGIDDSPAYCTHRKELKND